ncbi:MAG: FtsX-like permease family protein [bacterium]|nr:FtsX-like permease family protein [bacterium]
MSTIIDELRFAYRGLLKSPVLSGVAVLTLGLGIGMTALMFSLVYGALFRGLPFPDEQNILRIAGIEPSAPDGWMGLSVHDYTDLKEQVKSVEHLAGLYTGTVNVAGLDRPIRYEGAFITANGFESLQALPILGRSFREDEAVPGAPLTIILGYHVWVNDFGRDPAVLGKVLRVNGEQATVVGVMPEGFKFPDVQDVWVPYRVSALELPRGEGLDLMVYGRLAPGVEKEEAAAELAGIAKRIAADHPETNEWSTFHVERFSKPPIAMTLVFMTLLATVLLVLLVACTNVANLLLARAAGRTREFAVQMTLGATRARIVAKLLAESVLLVAAGAVLGIAFGWLGLKMVFSLAVTSPPPFWFIFEIDTPILLFVMAVSAVAAFVAGVVPGLKVTDTRISEVLKDEGRGSSSMRIGRLSRILVVAELALSVGLLVAAGLLVKGMINMRNLDYGIFQEEILTARVGLFETEFPDSEARGRFYTDLQERLLNRSEVTDATLTSSLPGLGSMRMPVGIQGVEYSDEQDYPQVGLVNVAPGFFSTFGVELISGRDFTVLDDLKSTPVALVNQSFVERFFPQGDAIGRQCRFGRADSEEPWLTIVGVVPDLYLEGLAGPNDNHPSGVYLPVAQQAPRFLSIAIRGHVSPEQLSTVLREEVGVLHADTPLYWVRTMARALREEIWYVDLFGGLFAVFGVLALLLAAAGLYAVMATGVARRTREVGIRMAVGACSKDIVAMVVRQGATQVVFGLILGLGLAALTTRGLQAMLLGIEPWDVSVFLAVSAVMLASGLSASLIPARRATCVDPAKALRAG